MKIIKQFKMFKTGSIVIDMSKLIETQEEENQFIEELKERIRNAKRKD